VQQWVNEAVNGGAQLLTGGQTINPHCYQPTLLLDPPPQAKVSQQEVFGPVICLYSYQHMDEAISAANSLPYAFQGAIFTQHLDTALQAYKQLNASAVMVNQHTAFRVDGMPFAGLKQSGLGVGGIPHTMADMQIDKMLVIRSKEI
jgi:acyl-CoA reductase-like NAD-dependent aldehyde dehydrogenase